MGIPQFMPTSVRSFAVDGSGDGRRDLWGDWSDVFASVGNYLKVHGWRSGEPIVVPATADGANLDGIATDQLELSTTVGALHARGVKFDTGLPDDSPAMLIALQGENAVEYRVGFANFYAITRYNQRNVRIGGGRARRRRAAARPPADTIPEAPAARGGNALSGSPRRPAQCPPESDHPCTAVAPGKVRRSGRPVTPARGQPHHHDIRPGTDDPHAKIFAHPVRGLALTLVFVLPLALLGCSKKTSPRRHRRPPRPPSPRPRRRRCPRRRSSRSAATS
jgi:hypothetical protein